MTLYDGQTPIGEITDYGAGKVDGLSPGRIKPSLPRISQGSSRGERGDRSAACRRARAT
jgi:hypothetical protein